MNASKFQLVFCVSVIMLNSCMMALADDVDYVRDIKPIFKSKCWSCHGALKQEGTLRIDTVAGMKSGGDSGPALEISDPLNSEILRRVSSADPDERMPPEGEPVSSEQIERIRHWLKSGAAAPLDEQPQTDPTSHWAFQSIATTLPDDSANGAAHPIDSFVDSKLIVAGLQRSPPADATSLIRRMFLDLHGLPPQPSDISHWSTRLSQASTPAIRTKTIRSLVDVLLSSPRYGERWAQHWLDIVRYADTHGFEVNTPRPNAWPYRDYVINAFNQDTPYDQFVLEQLAGDSVGQDAATGFLVAAAALLPGQIGKDEESKRLARQDELDEIIVGTTATFLGMTVGCARCHDHKFDPIPQTDYYAMQAFFAGVEYGEREVKGERQQQRIQQAAMLQPKIDGLRKQLSRFTPKPFAGKTIVIDDEDLDRVTLLLEKNGHGTNPDGKQRGYKDHVGSEIRYGNVSGGRYVWFDNKPGSDVFTWNPYASGRFRIWISWGVHGSGVHTQDARYVLDHDGDLTTTADQKQIATADQHYFSGQTAGESAQLPLWSGLFDAGVHEITDQSRLILRGGETGTGITADVIVLQEELATETLSEKNSTTLPLLRGPVSALKTVEQLPPTVAKFVRFTSFATIDNNKHQPCIDELEVFTSGDFPQNIALSKYDTAATSSGNYSDTGQHQLQHINDGRYGNSYSWISNEAGRGWVQLEFTKAHTIDRIEWSRDREGKFADRLPLDYQITTSIDGVTWSVVASSADRVPYGTPHDETSSLLRTAARHPEPADSESPNVDLPAIAKQLRQLEQRQAEFRKPVMAFAGKFKPPSTTFVLTRGDPEQPEREIHPRAMTAISGIQLAEGLPDQQRRIALAKWIASGDNPLTARVIVNRIWQYHFGVGLVESASDFGLNGTPPSHPQLLDWLATEFISSGWSIKHMHRLIMTSETFCQAAIRSSETGRTLDADNRLLWHFSSRRLEAESIRDCMLAVSGQLNLKTGGPGFDFFKSRGGLSGFPPKNVFTANEFRRMIYAHKIRMERVPVFGAFDCPDAGLPTPLRSQSTTAIQALNLFNSDFVMDQAKLFAGRVVVETPDSVESQIQRSFQLAFGRNPSAVEMSATIDVVNEFGLETLCRAIFNSSEFLFIP